MPTNLSTVPEMRRCGAKTRDGDPCKNWTIQGRTRCRMHGGGSKRGEAHPDYRHGWYSNEPWHRFMRGVVRARDAHEARIAGRLRELGFVRDEDGNWRR